MANVTFSLTRRVIVTPVLSLRNESHFLKREVATRLIALATSFFASLDMLIHLTSGIYKGANLLLKRNSSIHTTQEVKAHFQKTLTFALATLIGSVVSFVWPHIFQKVQRPAFVEDETPALIRLMINQLHNAQITIDELKAFWAHSDLRTKDLFVKAVNQEDELSEIREALASTVYRSLDFSKKVRWLNPCELEAACFTNDLSQGCFFHATSYHDLLTILEKKRIDVRLEKNSRGAFVSTYPEYRFGDCVLALRRDIERLSPLEHGFTVETLGYLAGFSKEIPVNEKTLAYIILKGKSYEELLSFQSIATNLIGRKIQVIPCEVANYWIDDIKDLSMGIPREWPEDGTVVSQRIIEALRITEEA